MGRKEARRAGGSDRFTLPSAQLNRLASPRIVQRGLAYARAGRVLDMVVAGDRLEALVQGTGSEPYVVSLEHDGEELLPECSCPFDWEPFCKHAVAALAVRAGIGRPGARQAPVSVEQEEIEVRRRRGSKQEFRVTRLEGDAFFGCFRVGSPSGRSYEVEIRSLDERINRCSCPDFASAMLGTCKHIEAVLHARRTRAPKAFERARRRPPQLAQVLVEQGESPHICLRLPPLPTEALSRLARDFFDEHGRFVADPVQGFAAFLEQARRVRRLVVYGDAVDLSARVAAERRAGQREQEVRAAVLAAGTRVPGVRATLYPYQVEGAAFLASRGRALLGDDMGLGKTVQAIAAARVLWDRDEVRRVLVVCPASLKQQWADEIGRFCELEAQVVGGSPAVRLQQQRRGAPFTITSYELVLRDAAPLQELGPQLLVLDEAQRIRNWRTRTAEAIKAIDTPFVFVLSGTPLQNRLDDLYSIMQVVDRRVLGPLWAFNQRFLAREERGRVAGYRNLGELRRRLEPVVLRRDKSEVRLQLPERIRSRIGVELTGRQRDLMDEGVSRAARLAAMAERRPLSPEEQKRLFAAMQTARMACNAASLVDKQTGGAPKLDELEQLISDLCVDRGRKVVVFSEWETFCRMAAARAERLGVGHLRLHGGVPVPRRGELIRRFRDDPACRLFISTDAGGVGLNLQFASTLINLDLPWNPAVLEQRIGRLHRHGQLEAVHVLLLVSDDSFESAIERVLADKRELFTAALDRRSTQEEVQAPAACLSMVRSALEVLEPEPGPEAELGEIDQPAAPPPLEQEPLDAAPERGAPEPEGQPDLSRKIADLLGSRLQQVLALPSGRLVAAVDRLDEVTRAAGERAGVAVVAASTLADLSALGSDSPLEGARVLLERPADDRNEQARRERLAVARRKLEAARQLAGADLGAEAVVQAEAAIATGLRAVAARWVEQTAADGGDDMAPARLLYEVLVPRGALSLEQAARAARVESLARAYSDCVAPVPGPLVQATLADAGDLLGQLGLA